jgi:hypothetical protein
MVGSGLKFQNARSSIVVRLNIHLTYTYNISIDLQKQPRSERKDETKPSNLSVSTNPLPTKSLSWPEGPPLSLHAIGDWK